MELEQFTKVSAGGVLRTPAFKEKPSELNKKHGTRILAIEKLTATVGNITIDADEKSMDRFDRVISIGIAEYLIASDPANPLWDEITFPWMDAFNQPQNITLRQAISLQKEGLMNLSALWFTPEEV